MAAPVEEFKFKLAKAKDLPPSWFELLLIPNKFQKHVNDLYTNTQVEPSALSLIAVFLEKAGCLEGQTQTEGYKLHSDRKEELLNCAFFMASFLHWDLPLLEKGLPCAVVYSLLKSLINAHPFSPTSRSSLTSHLLYHLWIVRFATCYTAPVTNKGLLWEGTCATFDTIKQLVSPHTNSSISFLLSQIDKETTTTSTTTINNYILPFTRLTLASPSGANCITITLPNRLESFSWKHIHTQVYYDVGQVLFDQEDYNKSLQCFQSCLHLLEEEREGETKATRPYPNIQRERLNGYLSACSSYDVGWVGHEGEEAGTVVEIEQLRKHPTDSSLLLELSSLLNRVPKLPQSYRTNFSLDVSDWSEYVSMEPSANKRTRVEGVSPGNVAFQYDIWRLVSCVEEGKGLDSTVIKRLSSPLNEEELTSILHIMNSLLKEDSNVSYKRLSLFLKSLHISCNTWDKYSEEYPLVNKLLINQDSFVNVKEGLVDHTSFTADNNSHDLPSLSRLIPILISSNPTQIKDKIAVLYKEDPSIGIALKGEGKSYLTSEQLKNPVTSAQYNMLIRKAEHYKREKDYIKANEFYSNAAQFLSSIKSLPNSIRHGLIPMLMEHSLRMRILTASNDLKTLSSNRQASEKYSSLIEEAKSHYGNSKSPHRDPLVTTLCGVFLLNLKQYNHVAHCDRLGLHERICPKLAVVAQSIQDKQDMRRCTRELFETISGVFSNQPTTGRGGGGSDHQSALRKYLELISTYLQDLVCLSYLMAAIARLWNLITKPEYDITMEYSGPWPTAVGHASHIDSDTVLRVLQTLVSHCLSLLPSYSLWLVIQGDIFITTGNYSSSLRCYLESGAQESDLFETDVPSSVWTLQVYHRMIDCCLKLNYQSHALVICQMMDPIDYSFTLSLLKENIQYLVENMFEYFWNMSIIESLIYILGKHGDIIKRTAAIQIASKPELNIHNPSDVLAQAKAVRRRNFLRNLYTLIINQTL